MTRKLVRALALGTVIALTSLALPAYAQMAVFDSSNYAQNLLQAARALQQVNNQIQQLQNEATMLQNMGKNLTSLDSSQLSTIVSALTQISGLMNQGSGIAFNVNATNAAWSQSFPSSYGSTTTISGLAADAQSRWQQAMAAFQLTLRIQSQVAQNVQADTSTLTALVDSSQGAIGNLQVTQASNQLLALSTKQQLQIQNLLSAQFRANALNDARQAQDEAAAQTAFTQFIGTGQAYTAQ